MQIEFHRPDSADDTLGIARWVDGRPEIEAEDDQIRAALSRIFRPTPVATDDASHRRQGTHGDVLIQPGGLEWFRAAAFARAGDFDLVARAVPDVREGGWDPAAQYRTFGETIELLERS